MVHVIKDKINFNISCSDDIELFKFKNYLLINLNTNDIIINNENKTCIFCNCIDSKMLYYKSFYICESCKDDIINNKDDTFY